MPLRRTAFAIFAFTALAYSQAHSYTKADIEEGIRSYRINCIGCHGADGTAVSGIDLKHVLERLADKVGGKGEGGGKKGA